MTTHPFSGLIADIGGTNARFALVREDRPGWQHEKRLQVADFGTLEDAARSYLDSVDGMLTDQGLSRPDRAAFCVACPVIGDAVSLTNNNWAFSIENTRRNLGLTTLNVVNDFVGNALACPYLDTEFLHQIGGGHTRPGYPVAVIGPGTGLGVALMIPLPDGSWVPVATEGGHVTLPATSDEEATLLARGRRRFGHISAERLISGPGLSLLYDLLTDEDAALEPSDVTRRALDGSDETAVRTLTLFCQFLGSVCGNLALTTGALGGVALMGGILPRMLPFLAASPFRPAFEDKGRFNTYLAEIPTAVITHPYPAFVGLEHLVRQSSAA